MIRYPTPHRANYLCNIICYPTPHRVNSPCNDMLPHPPQSKLSQSLEQQFTHPHQFEHCPKIDAPKECAFCKHQILTGEKQAFKCKSCGYMCHSHCRSVMPYNCGQTSLLTTQHRVSVRTCMCSYNYVQSCVYSNL